MAAIGRNSPVKRVSPLKPGLRGARNWATAQMRSASYSRKGFWKLCLSILFVVFTIGFIGLWLGGFLPDARQAGQNFTKNRLTSMGFVVERVDVMGEGRLRESDVVKALGVAQGDYLFGLDLVAAQNRVENLSWVDRAIVRRLWPNRIVVQIIERKPYALWQKNEIIHLVDNEGSIIGLASMIEFPDLPLIVGDNAPENYLEFRTTINNYPELSERVYAMVHHNSDRWDLVLEGGEMTVMLPTRDPSNAIRKLMNLDAKTRVLDRQISTIDLRLEDRISLSAAVSEPA